MLRPICKLLVEDNRVDEMHNSYASGDTAMMGTRLIFFSLYFD